jgi:hypothetical protein
MALLANNLTAVRTQVRVRPILLHRLGLADPLRQEAGGVDNPPKRLRRYPEIFRSLVPQKRDPAVGARVGPAWLVGDEENAQPGKVPTALLGGFRLQTLLLRLCHHPLLLGTRQSDNSKKRGTCKRFEIPQVLKTLIEFLPPFIVVKPDFNQQDC